MEYLIKAANIYAEDGIIRDGALHIKDGLIEDILDAASYSTIAGISTITTSHNILPGLIELHIHGAVGYDVMDGKREALEEISRYLSAQGVTGFLAATITEDMSRVRAALHMIDRTMEEGVSGAELLGAYVEGPYISAAHRGAHPESRILPINMDEIAELTSKYKSVKAMVIAPEKAYSTKAIEYLKAHNVIPAIGHTDAVYSEALSAIDSGARLAVHTFNGMRTFHHREPGVLGAVLTDDRIYSELIADFIHVHPAAVKLLYQCKHEKRLCLVSDSIRAAGLADGVYQLGQELITVEKGIPRTQSGGLAGSTLRLIDAVRNIHRELDIDLLEAVHMAALIPAEILGIDNMVGSLKKGKKANFIVVDDEFKVHQTYIAGKAVL